MGNSLPISINASHRSSSKVRTARRSLRWAVTQLITTSYPTRLGREIDAVDEAGVELLPGGEDDAEQLGPLRAQHARPRVGSIADLVGGLAHPHTRLITGARARHA